MIKKLKRQYIPSRRQAIIMTVLYVLAAICIWNQRFPYSPVNEVVFFIAFLSVAILYVVAAGGLSERE